MNKEIIINSTVGETRIAILENGKLVELFVEKPEHERLVGNIYLGKVVNVVKGMRAAFVDIGQKQDAFLHFSDIGESFSPVQAMIDLDEDNNHIESLPPEKIKEGQKLLVQIIKEPISTKGSRLTTQISIPGRFLVLVPQSKMVGVSKKVESHRERRRLKKIGRAIRPEGFGLIIRTAAEGRNNLVLKADVESLLKAWKRIEAQVKKSKPPTLVYKDMGMISSVIRDLMTKDVTRLVIDSRKLYRQIITYLKDVAHDMLGVVEHYSRKEPIFDYFKVEDDIQKSLARKVLLRSGGSIIFEQTEALAAIDVNSGRYIGGKNHEKNALKINLEAAREIARQLRLRDMGGIIVIDFIDMRDEKFKKRLHDELKNELRKDRAQANITQLSEFGLIEMTRERVRPSLVYTLSETCPTCNGMGFITSKSTILNQIESWIKRYRVKSNDRKIKIVTHPQLKSYLSKGFRSPVNKLMWKYLIKIDLKTDKNIAFDEVRFYSKKNEEITDKFRA